MANTKVQSEQIEDGSITADKLADGTIVAAELANNAVVTAAINADAVTGAKIADDAIDSEHYTDGSIDTAHIADAQITVAKMAVNSVDSDQYVDGSIDTVHLGDLQVTTAKIANGNISTAKLADNAVTSAKLDTNIDIAGTLDVTGATTLDADLTVEADGAEIFLKSADHTVARIIPRGTSADLDKGLLSLFDAGTEDVRIDTAGNSWFNGGNVGVGTNSPSYLLNVVAGAGSQNIFQAGQSGVSNGFSVQSDGSEFTYSFITGKVGIGTASPSFTLHVQDTIGTRTLSLGHGVSTGTITTDSAKDLYFQQAGTTKMTLDDAGLLGIGTTNPSAPLDVVTDSTVYAAEFTQSNTSNGDGVFVQVGSTASADYALTVRSDAGNTSVLAAKADGKVGIGTFSPAYLLQLQASTDTDLNIISGTSTGDFGSILFGDTDYPAEGRITYQNSDNAMRFWANRSQAMMIDSSGNVGIGNTSPSSYESTARQLVVGSGSGSNGITIASASDGIGRFFFSDGTSGGQKYDSFISGVHSESSMHFGAGATGGTDMQINSSGVVSIGAGIELGSGVNYNNSPTTANVLDDYEEGTWTPTMSGGASISLSSANYVKVGRFLHANCYFTFSGLANDGNVFKIDGLPFNCTSGNHYGGGVLSYTHAANTNDLTPLVQTGDNYIYFHELDGTSATVSNATMYSRFANGAGYILLNMFYMTT